MIGFGWCRSSINKQVSRLRHVFKWAAANELIPPTVHQALATVPGIRAGRSAAEESTPVKPVPEAVLAATLPRLNRHVRATCDLQLAMADHKLALLEHKKAVAAFKKDETLPAPEEPQRPTCKRFIVIDTTVEAVAGKLEDSPRGLALVRDELSGWLASFNQYKPGGKGGDASHWLEMFRGGTLILDRKTGDKTTVYVPRAAVSIAGTIQPKVLARCLGNEHFENGMAARLLLAMPPEKKRQWSDNSIDAHVREAIEGIYAKLLALDFDAAGDPIALPLTPEAQELFKAFVNEHGEEQSRLDDEDLEAAWSKLEGYAARFALIVHLVRWAAGENVDPAKVDMNSMCTGINLARWFAHETKRVYSSMTLSDEDRFRQRLVEKIREGGGSITVRELQRSSSRYSQADTATTALDELVEMRVGRWEHPAPSAQGGHPTRIFVLSMSADTDTTPGGDSANGGSVISG